MAGCKLREYKLSSLMFISQEPAFDCTDDG